MSMKLTLSIIICLFLALNSYCQIRYAKFIDKKTGKGIGYCTVASMKGQNGGFADSLGIFSISKLSEIDSVQLSALGYEKTFKSLKNPDQILKDTIIFNLVGKEVQLEEVNISSKVIQKTNAEFELGYFKNREHLLEVTGVIGRTNTLFIPNPYKNRLFKITKLLYSIDADESAKVRIQLFKKSK